VLASGSHAELPSLHVGEEQLQSPRNDGREVAARMRVAQQVTRQLELLLEL